MLIQTKLPNKFWKKAVLAANYLYNRTSHSALDFKSSYERRYGDTPDLSNIYVWGSPVWKKIPKGKKLNSRAEKHYIIGYGSNQWKLLDPAKSTVTWARDIRVVEDLKDQSAKKEFVDEEQLEFQDESDDNDSIISQSHDLETSTPFHSLPNTSFEGVVEEEFSNEFSNKFLDEEIENENSENKNSQTEHDQDTSLENFIN